MKKTFHNKPFQWRKLCFGKKPALPLPTLFFLAALAAFSGCDLLNNKPEIDLEKAIDDEIAWANAPFVPVRVEEGGLGTASPRGALDTAVKQGYSFSVNYVPKTEYPFRGWQAKLEGSAEFLASWTAEGETGQDQVKFVPLNGTGTEAEIFVYVKPAQRIIIGPMGLDAPELAVRVDEGGTGTASPRGSVSGIRLGFPFMVSFLPNAAYDFKGWQVRQEGKADLLGSWSAGMGTVKGDVTFVPKTPAGTEMELTITKNPEAGTIIVEPLDGNNPFLAVELNGGGLGTISPTGVITTVKQGFSFKVSFLSNPAYDFRGWQARYEGETGLAASWTGAGASGEGTVVFTPQNAAGTEVQVTILKENPVTVEGTPKKIIIGPLGADTAVLNVEVNTGGMGTASPQGLVSGVRLGFPFSVSYQPGGAYPFTGWQAKVEGISELLAAWTVNSETGADKVSFDPQNIMGTEIRVTILDDPGGKLVIGPLGADYPEATVRVSYPEGWGRSPQYGEISPKPRKGIPFEVSFSPAELYEFVEWRACMTADYNNGSPTAFLAASDIAITEGPDGAATVTLNVVGDITLIPWCEERPRITQSNPPLINNGYSYNRGQQIRIWFATALDPSTVTFGEGHIEISGLTIGDSSEPYDDPDTGGVNEEGDLTGRKAGASRFFYDPVWDDSTKTISIRPGDGANGTKLPPGDILITVTAGTGILSGNGKGMTAPVSFYYRTNTSETKTVYTAEKIWAVHTGVTAASEANFFYPAAAVGRDRRLRKNDSDKYEVTLYFSVGKTNPTDMTDDPTHCQVVEYHYGNLAGSPVGSTGTAKVYTLTMANGSDSIAYRTASGTAAVYKITHELQDETQVGIIRLVVLPYREGVGAIGPDTWGNADMEGRFAAAVLDNQPPSGQAALSLSGYAALSSSGGQPLYNYGTDNKTMGMSADFSQVQDNGGVGIGLVAASMERPWTMDEAGNVQWQYRIEKGGGQYFESAWNPLTATDISGVYLPTAIGNANAARNVQLRYKDALENTSGWFNAGLRVSYYDAEFDPISTWSASYNPDADTITLSWTNPTQADFDHVELAYTANGGAVQRRALTATETGYTITGVPRLATGGVREGTAVSNIYEYAITLEAHSASSMKAAPFKIWNFGTPTIPAVYDPIDPDKIISPEIPKTGMSVDETNPAIEIRDNENDNNDSDGTISLKRMALNNVNKKYVLMNDITLTGTWTPIGIYNTNTRFKGKFYGNGHTIRGVIPASVQHMGLFGVVEGAEIRDLCVEYTGSITAPSSGTWYAGGIAGRVYNSTKILNCLSKGDLTITESSGTVVTGGIAGALETGGPIIQNSYGGLNLTVNSTGEVQAGGLAGYMAAGSSLTVSTARGNMDITTSGRINVGGVTGIISGSDGSPALIEDCVYETGTIRGEASASATCYLGGIIGQVHQYAQVSGCYSRAGLITAVAPGSTGRLYFGGFAGYMHDTTVSDCGSSSPLAMTGTPVGNSRVGGFAGEMEDSTGAGVKLERCWASGDVNVQAAGNFAAGGLVGEIYDSSPDEGTCEISNCYATGNVNAVSINTLSTEQGGAFAVGGLLGMALSAEISESWAGGKVSAWRTTNGRIFAGGLVGSLGAYHTESDRTNHLRSSISNCYALGDVSADNSYVSASSDTLVYAGGLAGHVDIGSGYKIEYSFAAGSVTARSAGTGGATVYAGGVMGYKRTA
ncbi:MAG: hypothetical protein LBL28_08325, partial [Treponema sp.]|nr:hypothetical protein [Treponema sp.]